MQTDRLCVLDLETTGLDEQADDVLEVAAIFGGIENGRFVERGRLSQVFWPSKPVEYWHPAVVAMHGASGLLAEVMTRRSEIRLAGNETLPGVLDKRFEEFDGRLESYARRTIANYHSPDEEKPQITLCGNTVHFDLRFVRRLFPRFAATLSHRVLDVSTLIMTLEACGRARGPKVEVHRAMADCEESIRTLDSCLEWIGRSAVEGKV